jgi:hypothetical protein
MGKGEIHYIEVVADSDEKEQGDQAHDSESTSSEVSHCIRRNNLQGDHRHR